MEELLVKLLIGLLAPHGEEYITTDKLVDDLTICGEALKQVIRS